VAFDRSGKADPEIWVDMGSSAGNLLSAFWGRCRNQMIPLAEGLRREAPIAEIVDWWEAAPMERLYARYEAWKLSERLIDYTDMLEMAAEAPPTGTQWPVFVMDECQDSTRLQWVVAQGFARASECAYLGGDDDQAIYSWAGAHPDDFLAAQCGAGDPVILRVNHRSGAALVDNAQAFIRRNLRRVEKNMVAAREGGIVESLAHLPDLSIEESTFLMARAHYLMNEWMVELEDRAFPFVDRRGSFGVNGKAATAYRRFLQLRNGARIPLAEWRLLAVDAIASKGPWLVRGAKARLKELPREFVESTSVSAAELDAYGATEELVNAIRSGATEPLSNLPPKRIGYLRRVAEKYGLEMLDESRAAKVCQVGPIHQFKGLECDHAVLHSGMPAAAAREATRDREAERRVFYVAMTRPKERLSLVRGNAFVQWREIL
jgi:DNA helicase-2/ATP-dependent DNA helicase PcrA